MTQFMKKAFSGIRNAVGSITEPAADPRAFQPDQRESPMDSINQVQNARYEVDLALEHLEVLSEKARYSITTIEQQTDEGMTSKRFGLELKREINEEIASIQRQEEHLRRQQEVLVMSERRLVASIRKSAVSRKLEDASTVTNQAKQAADSALRDAGTGMRRLDAVINRARAATERLEDKSKVIDRMAGRVSESGTAPQIQLTAENRIISGFEDMESEEHHVELCRLAEHGSKATGRLVSEYQQLDLTIRRHQANPQAPGARLAISASRTFRQGLHHAGAGLEELTQMSFDEEIDMSTRGRAVAEELARVGQSESAIYRARLEFVALVKGDADATVEAVFDALATADLDDPSE